MEERKSMMKNLSAVIVNSRAGRHLKTPVPMLAFGDTTILNRTLTSYLDAGFSEVIVVLSYRGSEVQASLGPLAGRVQVVSTAHVDEEFGGLIRFGLERVSPSAKGFAIGTGDQPLLDKELLKTLGDRFTSSKTKILVPVCQGQLGYPVFFDASFLAEFRRLPPHGEVWDILKSHPTEVLDHGLYQTAVVRHVDDIEDYHAMLKMAGLPIPEPEEEEEEPVSSDGQQPSPATGATAGAESGLLGPVGRIESTEG
jgi:CTP:molybdopterin cytidylyltransferase MocA